MTRGNEHRIADIFGAAQKLSDRLTLTSMPGLKTKTSAFFGSMMDLPQRYRRSRHRECRGHLDGPFVSRYLIPLFQPTTSRIVCGEVTVQRSSFLTPTR